MSNEYNGWKLLDKIVIVTTATNHYKYGYPQGYIVDPSNKKQLESALSWGGRTVYKEDENGQFETDANDKLISHYEEAGVIETDNKGFRLQLLDCADGSSQGGKLSFWNCLISKDDKSYVVGINSELLLELMLQSTFTNGLCDKEICFARKNGNVGALHPKMTQYQDALKDNKFRKSVSTKKTSKWQLGHNYITLSKNDIYLGEFYQPIKHDYHCESSWNVRKDVMNKLRTCTEYGKSRHGYVGYENIHIIDINIDKNRKVNLAEDEYNMKSILDRKPSSDISLREYIDAFKAKFDAELENTKHKKKDRNRELKDFASMGWSGKGYLSTEMLATRPSRTPGDIQLVAHDSYYSDVNDVLTYMKEQALKTLRTGKYYTGERELAKLIKSTDGKLSQLDFDLIYEILKYSAVPDAMGNGYYVYRILNGEDEEYLYTYEDVFNRIKELLQ